MHAHYKGNAYKKLKTSDFRIQMHKTSLFGMFMSGSSNTFTQHKKASNHHANLPLEMYSFTL